MQPFHLFIVQPKKCFVICCYVLPFYCGIILPQAGQLHVEMNILLRFHPFILHSVQVSHNSSSSEHHVVWVLFISWLNFPSATATAANHFCSSDNSGWVVDLVSFTFRRNFTIHYRHCLDTLRCQLSISWFINFLGLCFSGTGCLLLFCGALWLAVFAGK